MKHVLILLGVVCFGQSAVLLTNGDFEQELSTGWHQSFHGQGFGDTLDRSSSFHPDPDYEVRVKKYDAAYARLYQTVNIATTDLEFAVSTKMYAREFEPESTRWAAASVILEYLDAQQVLLGQSRICHKTPDCPYVNTPTFHMIEVADTANWYIYAFNVDNELQNLPGVNPLDIAKIKVSLFDTTDGC